jgi:hypothetical protein
VKGSDGRLNVLARMIGSNISWFIVGFTKEGVLIRYSGIVDNIGLSVDSSGKIEVKDA